MFTLKTKHADGSYRVEHLEMSREEINIYLEDMAAGYAENLWSGEIDRVFPIHWQLFDGENDAGSGFVDEHGRLF